jgi:hypothetical protein
MGSYFNLEWGSSVYVKVLAYNDYGDSLESDDGNGAILVTVPDAPINLIENVLLRGVTQIGLLWEEGAHNGGTTVLDYQFHFDDGTAGYVQLAIEIELTQFLVTSLTNGQHYKFKVLARNAFGISAFSQEVQIICAYHPDPPTNIITTNYNDEVIITWDEAISNGLPLQAYNIHIQMNTFAYT